VGSLLSSHPKRSYLLEQVGGGLDVTQVAHGPVPGLITGWSGPVRAASSWTLKPGGRGDGLGAIEPGWPFSNMLSGNLSDLVRSIEESIKEGQRLRLLRRKRRADPNWKGCPFCFDTAIGELKDGAEVPCPDHNGLCL
jgi:hypothetical protein